MSTSSHTKKVSIFPFFQRYLPYIFLAVILIFGGFERTTGIFSNMILFLFDSARDLLYVKKIVIDHDLILIGPSSGGLQGYFHGVFWYYLLAIPFFLSRGNPQMMTLFMAFFSTLSILIAFYVVKRITNIYAGLLIATIYAFAYFSIQTSRFIWNPYPIIWIMPLYVYALYLSIQKKIVGWVLLSFITSLIFHFEAIYGICLFPTLLITSTYLLVNQIAIKQKLKYLGIVIFVFLIPLSPSILFDLKHNFLISKSIIATIQSGGANITHNDKIDKVLPLNEKLNLRFNDLTAYTINSISSYPLLNVTLFILLLYGLFLTIKEKQRQLIFFMLVTIFTLVVPFFVFINLKYTVWSYYWIGNPALYSLLLALSIGFIIAKHKTFLFFVFFLLALLIISYNPTKVLSVWNKGTILPGPQTLATQLAIVEKIHKDKKEDSFSVYQLTPPVYDYIYRYLFWWQGSQVYNKYPKDEKQKVLYLILEPNPDDTEGLYFKKNIIKTFQKPIRTFNFEGRVRVEKIIPDAKEQPVDPNFFPKI